MKEIAPLILSIESINRIFGYQVSLLRFYLGVVRAPDVTSSTCLYIGSFVDQ